MIEPRTTDDFWAAAKHLGEIIATQRSADRQAKRDARNARRRARYRANPPAPRAKTTAIVDDELDWEPHCRCHIAAPCLYCTNLPEADIA
jgi:hypothetical protein